MGHFVVGATIGVVIGLVVVLVLLSVSRPTEPVAEPRAEHVAPWPVMPGPFGSVCIKGVRYYVLDRSLAPAFSNTGSIITC